MLTKTLIKRTDLILSDYVAEEIGSCDAKIHSVFPNGFNLITNNNQLVFIGKTTQPLSAYGMAIEVTVFDNIQPLLAVDQVVEFTDEGMHIQLESSAIQLEWKNTQVQTLTMPTLQLTSTQQTQLLTQLRQFSLWNDSGFVLNQPLAQLFNQWRQGAMDDKETLYQLVGAGVGLTPSGDDFIQGLIMMERLTNGSTHIEENMKDILTKRQTTDVSRAYYDVLAKGYVNETWIELFQAVALNQPYKVKQAIEEIRHYGSTSGNDLLLGVQMYLENI